MSVEILLTDAQLYEKCISKSLQQAYDSEHYSRSFEMVQFDKQYMYIISYQWSVIITSLSPTVSEILPPFKAILVLYSLCDSSKLHAMDAF